MSIASALACIISGLITILPTYNKPPAYWNNASRKFFRSLTGNVYRKRSCLYSFGFDHDPPNLQQTSGLLE